MDDGTKHSIHEEKKRIVDSPKTWGSVAFIYPSAKPRLAPLISDGPRDAPHVLTSSLIQFITLSSRPRYSRAPCICVAVQARWDECRRPCQVFCLRPCQGFCLRMTDVPRFLPEDGRRAKVCA